MPNIKKVEYEALKNKIESLEDKIKFITETTQSRIANDEALINYLDLALRDQQREVETQKKMVLIWKSYYQAAYKVFETNGFLEIPTCFKPEDSIKYIVEQQERWK